MGRSRRPPLLRRARTLVNTPRWPFSSDAETYMPWYVLNTKTLDTVTEAARFFLEPAPPRQGQYVKSSDDHRSTGSGGPGVIGFPGVKIQANAILAAAGPAPCRLALIAL